MRNLRQKILPVLQRRAKWASFKALSYSFRAAATAVELYANLFPGVRLNRLYALDPRRGFAIIGAEIGMWNAFSPSLLPHPWWAVAGNASTSQAVGHLNGTIIASAALPAMRAAGLDLQELVNKPGYRTAYRGIHGAFTLATVAAAYRFYKRQGDSAGLVHSQRLGAPSAFIGVAVSTLGYGAFLLLGELLQSSFDLTRHSLRRFVPAPVAVPVAAGAVGVIAYLISDKILLRQFLEKFNEKAELVNRRVYWGYQQPWEPERSGSVWSHERWISLGAQGRVLVGGGPRARDITEVTGCTDVHEPIRIYGGLAPGRTLEGIVDLVKRELLRTGALHRSAIIIHTSTGTGWVPDWQLDTVEFLTGGNCANVTMQYSYVQSPVAYALDRDTPVRAAKLLIDAVFELLDGMPNAPKVFVTGESLGAYGTAAAFDGLEDMLAKVDGAVLSGAPRFTKMIREITVCRGEGSPERLPLYDGGRHVRFLSHPDHLDHDWRGQEYAEQWQHPRVAVVQHASDAIVWWGPELFWREPDWLREPGARGVPAPATQHSDVVDKLRWIPFTTGWQVAMDMLNSKQAPEGHGHNYRGIMVPTWERILGPDLVRVPLDPALQKRITDWITKHSRDTRREEDRFLDRFGFGVARED